MATKKKTPKKSCPNCNTEIHVAKRQCPECGHDFGITTTRKKKVAKAKAKKRAKPSAAKTNLKQQLTSERARLVAEQGQLEQRLEAIDTLLN